MRLVLAEDLDHDSGPPPAPDMSTREAQVAKAQANAGETLWAFSNSDAERTRHVDAEASRRTDIVLQGHAWMLAHNMRVLLGMGAEITDAADTKRLAALRALYPEVDEQVANPKPESHLDRFRREEPWTAGEPEADLRESPAVLPFNKAA